jgi:hypothetical protein
MPASAAVASLLGVLSALALGCQAPRFGAIDLAQPDWKLRTGQAVWKPDRDKPEIVGDLLLATRANGEGYLQFSKALPIVTARLDPEGWEVEFPPQQRRYAARSAPPARIVWLGVLRHATGLPPASAWRLTESSAGEQLWERHSTGERLEIYLSP